MQNVHQEHSQNPTGGGFSAIFTMDPRADLEGGALGARPP